MLHTIFKLCSQFLENAIFDKIVKNLFPQFSVFESGAPKLFTCMQTMNMLKVC